MRGIEIFFLGLAVDAAVVVLGPRRSIAPDSALYLRGPAATVVQGPHPNPDIATQYAGYLANLDEPDLRQATQPGDVFRALWLRSFDEPVAVRVVHVGNTYRVITKQGARRDSALLSAERWSDLHVRTAMKLFWTTVPLEAPDVIGVDGARWILEGREGTEYHAVDWWSPDENAEGLEGGYRRLFLEILSLGSVCVPPERVY